MMQIYMYDEYSMQIYMYDEIRRGVGGAVGLRKRKRSGLADEGLAKKRCEGT